MSCGSTNIHPFRSGHNLDSTDHKSDLLSGSGYHLVSNEDFKEPTYESLNPCRYDANLGADDTDGCSQTSSQDSVSDLSQETLPSSPVSASSDDQISDLHHNNSGSYGQWSHKTLPKYHRSWVRNDSDYEKANNGASVNKDNANHTQRQYQSVTHANDGYTFAGFTNVPFRFKEDLSSKRSQDSTPVAITTRTVHQQNPVPGSLPQSNRRRGCPTAVPVCPPKLRRDTENTDAIVKMIVIFCTNLISSIWSTSAVYETTASSHPGSNVLPLQIFITETLRRSKTSYSTLQVALYYLILLKQCLPTSQQVKSSNQTGCRAMQCGRRMFLTALILASKYLQDRNYSARAWSKISGLPLKEINDNERNYLCIVGWDLHVPKETFENWSKIVLAICRLSTEQDVPANGFESHPPSSGMPPAFSRHCQLQNMCRDITALRCWWTSSLRGLCTDIVRSCQKTEQYLLSVSPFRDGFALTKPIWDQAPHPRSPEHLPISDSNTVSKCLPRIPSIDQISQSFQAIDRVDSPAATLSMPPPPVLRNLPTPQTTPRSDMTNIWTPNPSKPNLRCRASASALSSLGRNCHPLANLDVCPPPAPRACAGSKVRSWPINATPTLSDAPDRSLTSSPESVISENWSFVGRSRSSSISSTSSFLTASTSSTNSVSDTDGYEKMRRDYMSMQQRIDGRHKALQQQCPWLVRDQIDRPKTAFRVSDVRPEHHYNTDLSNLKLDSTAGFSRGADLDDEGYVSSDYGLKRSEKEALQGLVAIKTLDQMRLPTARSGLQRYNTSIHQAKQEGPKAHVLKRSRSETLDLTHDSIAALYGCETPCPRAEIWKEDITKCITNPCQSYAVPRKPVPCGTQNKRLAVQTPTNSLAATMAANHLRHDITVT